ncbi:recombinase RecT [Paenibacillus alvei]|uniref:RecT family recombinase n=1 Tax=Paenibacillus alvei TaxID=44250 RepID=UPI000289074E|nr:RecT family recombinase [Paenibacillus alvei]EJW17583.1 protein RecT [Paenibacillus alvei DSM 29]MCY9544522.1 recombinase RecT [Paenibacillus alvei]MCY9706959.1 recombinase RecT [Paenibacillus alvei]MCY9736071.1 recombinase RecT [Paenibacillus alvei]MCY9755865.1 recombinase RecT [Paenibacillus alvei]
MSTAVQNINTQAVVGSFTQSELDTLKSTIAKGTSNEQFALFVQTCARSGLNPFLNQIYCIVYNGKNGPVMSIQIAVEGIVALAKKHPQYKGFIAAEIRQNDHFKAKIHTGEVEHEPDVMNPGETIGAYCVAYRENAPNVLVIVRRDQVEHLLKGRNSDMWRDYFDDMIVKHAIKRAFKRQFGIEVSEDEYVQPNSIDNTASYETRKDITADVESGTPQLQQPLQNSQNGENGEIKKVRRDISAAFKKLGITTEKAMTEYTMARMKQKGDKPTLQELTGLLKVMQLEIEEKEVFADGASEAGLEPLE